MVEVDEVCEGIQSLLLDDQTSQTLLDGRYDTAQRAVFAHGA